MKYGSLSLPEDLVLLALDEASGRLRPLPDRALDYALAGGFLAKLTLSGHLVLEETGLRRAKGGSPDDRRLAEVLAEVDAMEEKSLSHVLSVLASEGRDLRQRVIADLVEKGVLEETEDAILWVFHRSRYPAKDHRQEEIVRARLRRAILEDNEPPTESDLILVGLVHACQLDDLVLGEEELRGNREHLKALCRSHIIGRTVFDTIQEIHRALIEIRTYSGW